MPAEAVALVEVAEPAVSSPEVVGLNIGAVVVIGGTMGVAVLSSFLSSPQPSAPRLSTIAARRTSTGPAGGGVGGTPSRFVMRRWDDARPLVSSAGSGGEERARAQA